MSDDIGNRASFLFQSSALPTDQLRVLGFEGYEELSRPFEFVIRLLSKNTKIDLDVPLGEPACLSMLRPLAAPRHVHGIIERFELVHVGARYAEYEARLVPSLSLLRYTRHSRVLRGSILNVISDILERAGMPPDTIDTKAVREAPTARNYCVQYQESDWDFICRLLEEEGIFFYFQHTADQDILVLSDESSALQSIAGVDSLGYLPEPLAEAAKGEYAYELSPRSAVRPGKLALRDFRFKQPGRDLQIQMSSQDEKFHKLERYIYPGEYTDEDLGGRLGQLRLQELEWDRKVLDGKTTCGRLLPGYQVSIASHRGRAELNNAYVIVSVRHRVAEKQALGEEAGARSDRQFTPYYNEVRLLPKDVMYRPPRRTPRPIIQGIQSAVVVGPPNEEIWCDEYGRVLVQFHWDRDGKKDESSSSWVRVSQPWAGSGQGAIFIPRIGQEVLVQFLEGDPDRPVITGRVYNGENPVPHGLPESKNISTIRTASTPGGSGFNELKFDDTTGKEEVYFHAQRDHNEVILHNHTESVGANQSMSIGANQSLSVGRNRSHSVGGNETITVKGDQKLNVDGHQTTTIASGQSISVDSGQDVSITSGQSTNITGGQSITVTGGQTVSISDHQSTSITSGQEITITGGQTTGVTGGRTTTITGKDKLDVTSDLTIGVTGQTSLTSVGKISITSIPKVETRAIQIEEKGIIVTTEGISRTTSGLFITLQGVFVNIEGAFVSISGSQVSISGEGATDIKGGVVTVTGGVIKLNC